MNLNKVFIIGRLTQDPETRSTTSGQSVTTLRLATNRVWNNQSGQKQEAVEYHTVIAWARLGEIASQYLKKGGLVMIEGRIQTRSWMDQSNNKRYVTEIIAENLQLGPRPSGPRSAEGFGEARGFGEASQRASSGGSDARPAMSDVKKSPVPDADIPIIGENEPISSGMEEEERKISEKDLPF